MSRSYLRVVVIGHSCSGKSTLAQQLSHSVHVPYYDLDVYHWGSNWQPRPRQLFRQDIDTLTQRRHWIIAGNYAHTIADIVWSRATMMVYLELPLYRLLWNYLYRTSYRIRHGIPAAGGNYETVSRQLTRHSLGLHIMRTYRKKKRLYRWYMQHPPYSHIKPVYLKSWHEAMQWCQRMQHNV